MSEARTRRGASGAQYTFRHTDCYLYWLVPISRQVDFSDVPIERHRSLEPSPIHRGHWHAVDRTLDDRPRIDAADVRLGGQDDSVIQRGVNDRVDVLGSDVVPA